MCLTVIDSSVLYFDRFDMKWLRFDQIDWSKNCLSVFDPNVLGFVRFKPNWLSFGRLDWSEIVFDWVRQKVAISRPIELNWFYYDRLDCSKKIFDCVWPKRAMFRPTWLELAMLRPFRRKQNCSCFCLTHACYVLNNSIWTRYVWTDSAEARTGFDWVWTERPMFRLNRLK